METSHEKDDLESDRFYRDQTTVFSDKYETDVNKLTVANRLATVIVEYEKSIGDFKEDILDEINLEETNHDEMDNYLADLNSEESDMDSIYSDSTDIHKDKSLPDELKVQCEAKRNIKKKLKN